jgi:hypothetical protein
VASEQPRATWCGSSDLTTSQVTFLRRAWIPDSVTSLALPGVSVTGSTAERQRLWQTQCTRTPSINAHVPGAFLGVPLMTLLDDVQGQAAALLSCWCGAVVQLLLLLLLLLPAAAAATAHHPPPVPPLTTPFT